jgi:26S proteasome regulatory subunit N8
VHTPSIIEAEEAEEIGVEHLLRDVRFLTTFPCLFPLTRQIRDVAIGTLSNRITGQLQSLQGLHLRLRDIGQYLQKVLDHELPINHAILGNLQDIFNLLPNLSTPKSEEEAAATGPDSGIENSELVRAMSVKTNDQLMAIYLSSLIRAITAFHDLIENKIQNRQRQEELEVKKEDEARKQNGGSTNGEKEGKEETNKEKKKGS